MPNQPTLSVLLRFIVYKAPNQSTLSLLLGLLANKMYN